VERVRVSAGIAELRPEDDWVALCERADDALYRAKELGKGQVHRAEAEAGPNDRALEPGAPS
jgi:PleD family two-component response regulator